MVKLLLDHKANPNRLSRDRHTPLVASLFGSSLKCFQALIQAGADIKTSSRVTPLSVAARKGLADCIKQLLDIGADPNETDEDDKLPVQTAASRRWTECVEILLPVTNLTGKYANTPSAVELIERESTTLQDEITRAIADGDVAYWEKNYAHALRCYTKALKLGHEDASLYAKRSLCHLNNHDQLRYLDDAFSYTNAMNSGLILPCFEEKAQRSVLAYFEEWKARYLADEASRSNGRCNPQVTALKEDAKGSKNVTGVPSMERREYYCKNCGEKFETFQKLGSHRRTCNNMVSSGSKKCYCKYCGKDFPSSRSCAGHMGTCKQKKAAHKSSRHMQTEESSS
ncbi:unnamed protein product [Urochloa humidicola]